MAWSGLKYLPTPPDPTTSGVLVSCLAATAGALPVLGAAEGVGVEAVRLGAAVQLVVAVDIGAGRLGYAVGPARVADRPLPALGQLLVVTSVEQQVEHL